MFARLRTCRKCLRHPILPLYTKRFESSISPVLLNRARNIATEHAKLTDQNAENYDIGTAKKIGELSSVTTALVEWESAENVIGTQSLEAKAAH
jgi:peptide chain release factor 1